MSIDLVIVDEMSGSADGLRAVSDRIRGDFFCLGSDFISQYCIGELASMHRISTSDLTMMLTMASPDVKKDEVDEEYIGICDDGRVMVKLPTLEIDESIELSKPLLHHAPSLSLRPDLVDLGIYLMAHWVLEFLASNTRITSIRSDLLPYLINRQYQSADHLLRLIPALEHRNRPLKAIEPWIMDTTPSGSTSRVVQSQSFQVGFAEDKGQAILDVLDSHNEESGSTMHRDSPVPNALDSPATAEAKQGGAASTAQAEQDLLRCFAVVYEPPARTEVAGAVSNITILSRVVNIPAYLNLNK